MSVTFIYGLERQISETVFIGYNGLYFLEYYFDIINYMTILRLLLLILVLILAAFAGKKYNTPEVKQQVGELVAKIRQSIETVNKEPTPREKQSALTKNLETNLSELEDILKIMEKNQSGSASTEQAETESHPSGGIISQIFGGKEKEKDPEERANNLIEESQRMLKELKSVNSKIAIDTVAAASAAEKSNPRSNPETGVCACKTCP